MSKPLENVPVAKYRTLIDIPALGMKAGEESLIAYPFLPHLLPYAVQIEFIPPIPFKLPESFLPKVDKKPVINEEFEALEKVDKRFSLDSLKEIANYYKLEYEGDYTKNELINLINLKLDNK